MTETFSVVSGTPSAPSPPSTHPKIRPSHLLLAALVYLRQSTPEQVRGNLESQRRQYALRDRALVLGWTEDRIQVIDEDLGRSGSESRDRTGFQRLLSEVALGHVGIILALEASRLARNNADWQHLLRLCTVTNTLIADAENVYDPRLRDDRILLGFKGTYSEWELDSLRDRLVDGARNKALRGELYTKVPVGYVLSTDLEVELHSDQAVREAILLVFHRFQELGSIHAAARSLHGESAKLPVRQDAYGHKPPRWVSPTFTAVQCILTNPFYAGAYAYGKTKSVAAATPEGEIVHLEQRVPFGQWTVFLPQHHPAYVSWEEFLEIQKRVVANRRGFCLPGPVGEGPSLLAGILRCGPCGRTMTVSYGGARHHAPHFKCARRDGVMDLLTCQSFPGRLLEQRLSEIVLEVLAPHGMEATLLALEDWEAQRVQQERQWDLEVTRAEEKEARARHKYEEVEPGHRLVSRNLELAWEQALQVLEEARRARELRRSQIPPALTEEEQRQLRRSAHQLEELWKDEGTAWKDRKEIVRLLVHHVEAWTDAGARRLTFRIHWTTGKITEEHVALTHTCARARETRDSDVKMIQRMSADYSDQEIAHTLTRAGRRQPSGVLWTGRAVKSVREARGWEKSKTGKGQFATLTEAMQLLGIHQEAAYRLFRSGKVKAEQPYPDARWRVDRASLERWSRKARRQR